MSYTRIEYADIAKAIAIIAVVTSHEFSSINILDKLLSGFMLPVFFFFSGYFINKTRSVKKNTIVKIRTLLVPYISLGIITSLLSLLYRPYNDILSDIQTSLFSWQTLWFLPVLFTAEFISFLIVKQNLNNYILFIISCLLILIGSLLNNYQIQIPLHLSTSFVAASYCISGYLSRQTNIVTNLIKQRHYYLCLTLTLIYIFLQIKNNDTILNLNQNQINPISSKIVISYLGIACIILISNLISKMHFSLIKNSLLYIGKNTLIILAFHMPIFFLIQKYIRDIISSPFIYKITECFLLWGGILICIVFINKYLSILLGKNK